MTDPQYAGDMMPREAWAAMEQDADCVLVDVRTDAEFTFVGQPDLSALAKHVLSVPWKIFPAMDVDPAFADKVAAEAPDKDQTLLFMCRSGVRSRDAAAALTARGYTRCFNILHGFEGDCDGDGHRGCVNGWKVDGLPWSQN